MYLDKEVSLELDPEVHVTHSLAIARSCKVKHDDVVAMAKRMLSIEDLSLLLPVLQVDGRTAYGLTKHMSDSLKYLFKR